MIIIKYKISLKWNFAIKWRDKITGEANICLSRFQTIVSSWIETQTIRFRAYFITVFLTIFYSLEIK